MRTSGKEMMAPTNVGDLHGKEEGERNRERILRETSLTALPSS